MVDTDVFFGATFFQKFINKIRIAGCIFKTLRQIVSDAVEIGSQADVIDPHQLYHMLDMRSNI